MYYFVFDLDETLGQMHSVFYFLCDLRQKTTTLKGQDPPPDLVGPINLAYREFVRLIAEEEDSDTPLGILRPGILEVMSQLKRLKRLGTVANVIIYSNNGSLSTLNLVRDVIHYVIKDNTLICDTIHLDRAGREPEKALRAKTWEVLSQLLKTGPCKAPTNIKPSDIFFFDDLKHVIAKTEGIHYIQVAPYKYKTSFDRLAKIYLEALDIAGITIDSDLLQKFLKYTRYCSGKISQTIEDHLALYREYTPGTAGKNNLTPPMNIGSQDMFQAILSVSFGGEKRQNNAQRSTIRNYTNIMGGSKHKFAKTYKKYKNKKQRKSRAINRK
jgi:hypothetical protein